MVLLDYIDALYGIKKKEIKKVREEVEKYCPNCGINVKKGEFTHDIYKTMYPCVLQWDQLTSLPRKVNYYDKN